VGEGLVENVYGGEELAENVRIPSYEGEPKITQKNRHMIFERSLSVSGLSVL